MATPARRVKFGTTRVGPLGERPQGSTTSPPLETRGFLVWAGSDVRRGAVRMGGENGGFTPAPLLGGGSAVADPSVGAADVGGAADTGGAGSTAATVWA